jgi:hypothetical protein
MNIIAGISNLPLLLLAFREVSQYPLRIMLIIAGISNLPLLLLAFRAVSQQPLEYFLQERDRLTKPDPR